MKLEDKLKLWAQSYAKIPNPLNSYESIPFLEPEITGPTGDIDIRSLPNSGISILVGEGGSGKSTLSRRMAFMAANAFTPFKDSTVPLFVRLRNDIGDVKSRDQLFSYLTSFFSDLYSNPSDFQRLFEDADSFIVFDGLDEIFDPVKRETFYNFVRDSFPDRRVLLTSRPNNIVDGVPHYTIKGVPINTALKYVKDQYELKHHTNAARLMELFEEGLEKSPFVRDLIRNPVLLEQARIINQQRCSFGRNIFEFIESMVEAFGVHLSDLYKQESFNSAPARMQYGYGLLEQSPMMKGWGAHQPVSDVLYTIAHKLIETDRRSMPLSEFSQIIYDSMNLHHLDLSEPEKDLMAEAFLYFCPAFCEYEREHYGFIHMSLQDNVGAVFAAKSNPINGYDDYMRKRDSAMQQRFFECVACQQHGKDWLESFVKEGLINTGNIQPFYSALESQGISFDAKTMKRLDRLKSSPS